MNILKRFLFEYKQCKTLLFLQQLDIQNFIRLHNLILSLLMLIIIAIDDKSGDSIWDLGFILSSKPFLSSPYSSFTNEFGMSWIGSSLVQGQYLIQDDIF